MDLHAPARGSWYNHVSMNQEKQDFFCDWLGRNGLGGEARAPISRHHNGRDGDGPMACRFGRRETDVRDGDRPGATQHAPNAGQLEESHALRGVYRHIHGDAEAVRLPANAVIYGDEARRRAIPPPGVPDEAPHQQASESFYLGDGHSNNAPRAEPTAVWRRGDKREFVLGDTAAPIPPAGPHADTGWCLGPRGGKGPGPEVRRSDLRRMEVKLAESQQAGESAFGGITATFGQHPSADSSGRLGIKLTDIHDGWQGLHRADPPDPAVNAFRRSASDVTLMDKGQNAHAQRLARAAAGVAALTSWQNTVPSRAPPPLPTLPEQSAGMSSDDAGRGQLREIAVADYELAKEERVTRRIREASDRAIGMPEHYRHTPTDIHLHSYEDTKFRQVRPSRALAAPLPARAAKPVAAYPSHSSELTSCISALSCTA